MAGAPKKTKALRVAVSANLHAYLSLLAKGGILGASENDVATFLLTQRLEEMLVEGYHSKNKLPANDC